MLAVIRDLRADPTEMQDLGRDVGSERTRAAMRDRLLDFLARRKHRTAVSAKSREVARLEGLFCGPSSGGALWSARENGSGHGGASERLNGGGTRGSYMVRCETMPPKSTYFYPKLLTGLVYHSLKKD